MKSTGIGDMIVAVAVVRDIVASHPDAEVIVFAGGDNADLARLTPGVQVVQLETAKPWRAVPAIRRERLDVFLDLGQWTRLEAIYAALSGASWTAGFSKPGQRRESAFDVAVAHRSNCSELDNFRAVAATIGSEPAHLPSFEAKPGGAPLADPYVVFHLWPGGFRSELRQWPQQRWRELVAAVIGRGFGVLLTGGPADVERTAAFADSCGSPPGLVSIAGRHRLHELTGILVGARCVVSVTTGIMHLAAACGASTVGLNGPTSSLRWGAIGPRVVNVDSELPGCGFLDLGFEYDGQRTDCMDGIPVERVLAATLGLAGD